MDRSLIALAAALAISLTGAFAAASIGKATSTALDATARQPEMAGKIQTQLVISIVFIETIAIYALVVSLLLVFVF